MANKNKIDIFVSYNAKLEYMKHFIDEEYDSMKEYETHIGCNYESDSEEHSLLWREEYEQLYDDKSMLFGE